MMTTIEPPTPARERTAEQEGIVREHFKTASTVWGSRYQQPSRMSDLDMLLRRENMHRLAQPLIARAGASGLRVLDLGCGTGNVLEGLPRDSLRVTGVDFVPEMVAAAALTHPHDCFAAADAGRLPFADASFDLITCAGVLEYIPDAAGVLKECHRVLSPGGHVIVSFPNASSWFRTLSRYEETLESAAASVLRRVRGRQALENGRPRYQHAQWSQQQGSAMLSAAGFGVEAARFNTYGLWGRLCRRTNMKLSRWMSRRWGDSSLISRHGAFTMIIRAVRSDMP